MFSSVVIIKRYVTRYFLFIILFGNLYLLKIVTYTNQPKFISNFLIKIKIGNILLITRQHM